MYKPSTALLLWKIKDSNGSGVLLAWLPMRNLKGYFFLTIFFAGLVTGSWAVHAQESSTQEPPPKLHGKALKEKEDSIQVMRGQPNVPYERLAPIWSSKSDMEKTMKDLRKQAAKLGADAVIDITVHTEKLQSTDYDPGWWGGPGWGGGFGPGWGYWGGMGYWGGYAVAHTYTQPVVKGWAIRWKGPPPQNVQELPPKENLEQAVENAPED